MLSDLARIDTSDPVTRATGIEGRNNEHLENLMLMTPELSEASRECPIVAALLKIGSTPDEIILMLAKLKSQLLQDVENLKLLAPKRVRLADGRLLVWRCPEELIPVQEMALSDVAEALWELPRPEPTEAIDRCNEQETRADDLEHQVVILEDEITELKDAIKETKYQMGDR